MFCVLSRPTLSDSVQIVVYRVPLYRFLLCREKEVSKVFGVGNLENEALVSGMGVKKGPHEGTWRTKCWLWLENNEEIHR